MRSNSSLPERSPASKNTTIALTVASLAMSSLSTLTMPGCDRRSSSFSSRDLANDTVPKQFSTRTPLSFKLPDGTLLCLTQSEKGLFFFATASGYGESGSKLDLKVLSLSRDKATAGEYIRLHPLEAYTFIPEPAAVFLAAARQFAKDPNSVDPDLVATWAFHRQGINGPAEVKDAQLGVTWRCNLRTDELIAELRAELAQENTLAKFRRDMLSASSRVVDSRLLPVPDLPEGTPRVGLFGLNDALHALAVGAVEAQGPTKQHSHPVYLRLADGTQLMAVMVDEKPTLARTAAGYAAEGASVSLFGIGGGREITVGMKYFEISPREVSALLDGNWQLLVEQAQLQVKFLPETIPPERLKTLFSGL